MGGVNGCRYLKEQQIANISIAYYLTLAFESKPKIKGDELAKFTNWYILNWCEKTNNEINALKKFKAIHSNIWNLLALSLDDSQEHADLLAHSIIQILD